jgi:hypothetical protein
MTEQEELIQLRQAKRLLQEQVSLQKELIAQQQEREKGGQLLLVLS